jgi:chromosome segregation ATPase
MADATLKDVLKAIAELRAETKADIAKLDAKVDDGFSRVAAQLTELDRDLTKRMDVHREIEKDIEGLKRRPARTAARAPRRPRTR